MSNVILMRRLSKEINKLLALGFFGYVKALIFATDYKNELHA